MQLKIKILKKSKKQKWIPTRNRLTKSKKKKKILTIRKILKIRIKNKWAKKASQKPKKPNKVPPKVKKFHHKVRLIVLSQI